MEKIQKKIYAFLPEYKNHKEIMWLNDPKSGLRSFIAIHSTASGPAVGGTRIYPYKNVQEAIRDVLRLSNAMTYKCAIAGLPFGGGKGVIIADPKKPGLRKILRAYAEKIDELGGEFCTGEDVGLSEADVQYMLKFSPYFIGKSHLAGDPSPFAGESAFLCAKVAWKHLTGTTDFSNKMIKIKGAGKTGSALAAHFVKAGANVFVTDINSKATQALKKKLPSIKSVSLPEFLAIKADIYSPCAMGNDINKKSIEKVQARLVAGTANNQLESMQIAQQLHKKGILHVPDYISNAGGLIDVADELMPGGYKRKRVESNIKKLQFTLQEVLKTAAARHLNPDLVANEKAEKIFMKKPFNSK